VLEKFCENLIKVAQKPGGTGGAMDRVIARLAFMMVCGMLLVAGCSAKEPVKIGFIGGMSGRVADLGVAGRNGAVLAIEQKNAAGGINGRKLELLVRDDEQKPEVAGKVVAELLAQKVELIIGPMTSSMAFAILPRSRHRRPSCSVPRSPPVLLAAKMTIFCGYAEIPVIMPKSQPTSSTGSRTDARWRLFMI